MGDLYRAPSSGLQQALKEADQSSIKTGEDAFVEEILEFAGREINSQPMRPLWQDATEYSSNSDRLFQTEYTRARRSMSKVLNVSENSADGQTVGHALVKAAEGGYLNVVKLLRNGLVLLAPSVLVPRFLAFALLKAVENGSIETVKELLKSCTLATLALMGYELSRAKEESYPYVKLNLTKVWRHKIAGMKSLLPPARCVCHSGSLELRGVNSEQEAVHDATRSCFRIYYIWRLLVVAAANSQASVFDELLLHRDKNDSLCREGWNDGLGREQARIEDLMRSSLRIDHAFSKQLVKITAKLGRDAMCYDLWRRTEEANTYGVGKNDLEDTGGYQTEAKSQFGVWEIYKQVPTLLTALEASYQDEKHVHIRRFKYVKPLLPQETTINIQFQLTIEIAPNYIELVVGINHVRVHVANASWDEKRMGHFPARVEFSITPSSERAGTVSMTGSSTNTSYKVGVSEQVRVGFHTTIKAAASAGFTFTAGTSSASKVEAKPWNLEQLPVSSDRGGKYVWTLTNLRGAGADEVSWECRKLVITMHYGGDSRYFCERESQGYGRAFCVSSAFNRLDPLIMAAKTSIWQFGRRIPINPLFTLPFTTQGGVNFTGSEFPDTLAWRFPKEMENEVVQFNIEGLVSTTHLMQTQSTFWETRGVPFEVKLEQKLEPCGEPGGGDKKKKKKKK